MRFVCSQCGHRQDDEAHCSSCRYDVVLDFDKAATREHLEEVEMRLRDRHSGRCRAAGVALGMVAVVGLWLVPGYWSVRSRSLALPLLADQWLLMAVIGYGVMTVLERTYRPRFPYLVESTEAAAENL